MNVNELLDKLRSDPAFVTKYGGLETIEQLQAQLKSDGYNLTTEEIKAGLNQLNAKAGELSDVDLAGVTGGADDGQKVGFYKKACPKCGQPTEVPTWSVGTIWRCTNCEFTFGHNFLPDEYDK